MILFLLRYSLSMSVTMQDGEPVCEEDWEEAEYRMIYGAFTNVAQVGSSTHPQSKLFLAKSNSSLSFHSAQSSSATSGSVSR